MIIYYTDKYTGCRDESHRLLAEAVAAHTGDPERADMLTAALKKGEHGKPYIEGFSCFSVSHTGSIWAVLIADCECGLDIQLSRDCNAAAIAERWFAAEDALKVRELSLTDRDEGIREFFRLWARREALVKALGLTVYEPELPPVSYDGAFAEGRHFAVKDIEFPDINTPHTAELYAAVCAEGNHSEDDICFCAM